MCREKILGLNFSTTYWKVVDCVIAEGVLKEKGYYITADNLKMTLDTMKQKQTERKLQKAVK